MLPLVDRQMMTKNDDTVPGFDFGYARGEWNKIMRNPAYATYLAEPTPGIGVILFKSDGRAGGWHLNFFPVTSGPTFSLGQEFANYTVWKARADDHSSIHRIPHYGNLNDVLTITALINHHTIGEENDRVRFRSLPPRLPHAQPEGPASGSYAHRSRNKDVG